MNKKKIILFTIITFLIIMVLLSIFIFYNRNLKYKNIVSIKIGERLPEIDSYVDKNDLKRLEDKKINWQGINVEDNKVYSAGKYVGYITFRNKKIKLNLKVIDDIKPTIEGVKDITIYVNEEIDFLKNVIVKDNSHDDVKIEVNGDYDKSKVGEYQLSYVATDKSGNEEIKYFKLNVEEKKNLNENINVNENVSVGVTSNGYTIRKINGLYYINDILIVNKTYSLSSSYNPNGLLTIFMDSFYRMQKDAINEGINFSIVSGFRSYYRQATIYNNYVNRDGKNIADTYSARAGHSEHQSGLAADVNSLNQDFINTIEGQWLNNNCYKYGFIIRYPNGKESVTGYMYEPWHIRYVGNSLASKLYNGGDWITLEEYFGITSNYSY